MLSEKQDINLKKLALFDCTEGLTKSHTKEEFRQVYGYFRAKIANGSFSETWLANQLLDKHEDKMRSKVVIGYHEQIEEHAEAVLFHLTQAFEAYRGLWKVRLTYQKKKKRPQENSISNMDS